MSRQRLKSVALFMSGMVTMGVLILALFSGAQDVRANEYIGEDEEYRLEDIFPDDEYAPNDAYSCIRQDLDARLMDGNIPKPSFSIYYSVPDCYGEAGYAVDKVFTYSYGGETYVAVNYKSSEGGL